VVWGVDEEAEGVVDEVKVGLFPFVLEDAVTCGLCFGGFGGSFVF
jgi:hypothetical protein